MRRFPLKATRGEHSPIKVSGFQSARPEQKGAESRASKTAHTSRENSNRRFSAPQRARTDWIALAALMATSCFVFLWNLDASGYANEFYSAAAQAGSQNWEAFLWGSLDAGNAITVDKPPAAIWLMALSVRLLGLSPFAILLPQALMGIACTYLCYAITRRYWGNWAGIAAGLAFTFTPVAALMFRFNNPDALLVLLMLSASGCVLRGLENDASQAGSRKRTLWFIAAGALIGFGFLTKQLQVFLVLPGFALAMFAFSPAKLRRRFLDAAAALGSMAVAAGWWVLLTVLVPSGARPYIGGSQTDSFLELTFGYNGLGRLTGNEVGSVIPGASGTAQGGMWGETGIFRLFGSGFNDQITWLSLIAFAGIAVGIVAAYALKKRAKSHSEAGSEEPRFAVSQHMYGTGAQLPGYREECAMQANETARLRFSTVAIFGSWLVVTWVVFSFMAGIFHQYYTVALAPAVAIMAALCLQGLWELRHHTAAKITGALLVALSSVWAFSLVQQSGWQTWLAYVIVVAGTGSAALGLICALLGHGKGISAEVARTSRRGMRLAVAIALVTLMTAPIAWTGCTIAQGHHGSIVTAGPSTNGTGAAPGGMQGSAPSDDASNAASNNQDTEESLGGAAEGIERYDGGLDESDSQQNGPANANDSGNSASSSQQGQNNSTANAAPQQSGPGNGGGGSLLGGSGSSEAISSLLKENANGYRWAAATTGSQNAAGYQLASELPVMAIGGFNGSDPAPTLDEFKSFVEEGLVRYYISSNGIGDGQMGGSDAASEIAEWVSANFEAQTIDGITVYDLSAASTSY